MGRKRTRNNYKKPRDFKPRNPAEYFTKDDIFISRMASILRLPRARILSIFNQRAKTTIRLNSLRGDVRETYKLLKARAYELTSIPWAPNTYFVNNRDKAEISQVEEYRQGRFYIQDLSSILVTIILNPKPKDKILDMCSAPGSKTTHIADLTNNKADIMANELEVSRTNSLRNVIDQFGAENTKITLSDGRDFGKKYPDYFDKVLLDAPCSGEGRIYMRGPKPLRFWSIKKVKSLSMVQEQLLESAFITLKTGGTLIYSTCTLEPEENEGVVTSLLKKHKNAKVEEIELIESKGFKDFKKYVSPGIVHWSGNDYDPSVKKSIRILPSSEMMGFYIAKIAKK
ncbi:MAG: RNA methylase, NOL1/NOP2/sun family [candidate division WS6 bacterium GW2011_GWE1_34_7]|uniref:RNA methylase, NOL1/NOP2/sun family n=1 Tax=candidate division WS6 bacterium GW2011_GWE1_34_7 TaxID=1619093 RepID=A0A0G0DRI1_9BACT|nr:MAG: RNA methylase, NOL1/NOP2/sun family [candidate division WS6 bacterium GW2011_GWE1_34_7]